MVRYLALGPERTFAVSVAEASKVYIDIVTESLNPTQDAILAETAGRKEARYAFAGPYVISGDIEVLPNVRDIKPILHAFTGGGEDSVAKASSVAGSYAYDHSFVSQDMPLGVTIDVNPDTKDAGAYKMRELIGGVLKSLEISIATGELLTATLGAQGRKDKLIARGQTDPGFTDRRPFVCYEGLLKIGGDLAGATEQTNVAAFTLTHERDVPDDAHIFRSRFLPETLEGRVAGMTATGSIECIFDSWDMYKRFWGGAAVTKPEDTPAKVAAILKFEGAVIPGAAAKETIEIEIPSMILTATDAGIDRLGRIVQSIDFTAYYDADEGFTVKYKIKSPSGNVWGA